MLDILPDIVTKNEESVHTLGSIGEVVPSGRLMHLLWRVKEKGKSRFTCRFMV